MVGGYAFFNYRNFGYFVVTPKLGLSLSIKTVRVIERLPDEYAAIREILIRARDATLVTGEHVGYMYIWGVVPQLKKITGFEQPQLSDYMLKLNLMLIREAPLNYLQEVFWAFGSYWLPSSSTLANFDSRSVQLFWGVIHFLLVSVFAFNLVLLLGAAIYLKASNLFGRHENRLPLEETRLTHLQGFMYGLAGMIVFYTAVVSCLIEVGSPRYRVPTDGLIVFMLFLGTHLWRRLVDLSRSLFDKRFERADIR
jgi:hypothetical protein